VYQPIFPLQYSERDGAYKNIEELNVTIKQNFLFLLNTSPGEWPGNPDLGIGVRSFLFENYQSTSFDGLHQRIQDQVSKYMPFLDVRSEIITKDMHGNDLIDYNTVKLKIYYSVASLTINEVLQLNLTENAVSEI